MHCAGLWFAIFADDYAVVAVICAAPPFDIAGIDATFSGLLRW